MIDVRDDHLKIVTDILSKYVPSCEVRVFGSRVGGQAKKHSDLDLAIMTDSSLPVSVLAHLRDAFSEAELPFKVDVIDWSAIGENFRKIVQEKFEIVQHRGGCPAPSIRKTQVNIC